MSLLLRKDAMHMIDYKKVVETLPHDMSLDCDGPSLEEAVNHIDNMDFSLIMEKLTRPDPTVSRVWSMPEVEVTVQYYKNFLFLNKKYLHIAPVIVPSIEVDEIWHHHILDTRSYHKDCMAIFGYYFHHYPYFGMRGENDHKNLINCFEATQKIYEHEFGERMKEIWN